MAERYIPGVGLVDSPTDPTEGMGAGERFAVGAGRGFYDFGEGAIGSLLRAGEVAGLAPQGIASGYQQSTMGDRALFDRRLGRDLAAGIGRAVGQSAPLAVIPGGGATLAGRIAMQAGVGAGLAGITSTPGENSLVNMATGAGLGGAGAAALGGLGAAGRALANFARGKLQPGAREIIEAGKRTGVPVMGTDVAGQRPNLRRVDQITEHAGVLGMTGPRVQQMQAAQTAAERLAGPATDTGETIQRSLRAQTTAQGKQAKRMYDRVLSQADQAGVAQTSNTAAVAQRLLNEPGEALGLVENPTAIGILKKLENPISAKFSTMHRMRSRLGEKVRDLQAQNRYSDARPLAQLKEALEQDMEEFVSASGNRRLQGQYREANKFFKDKVVPLREGDLSRAVQNPNSDEVFAKFIQPNKADRAQRFYTALDEQGREAVRMQVLQNALQAGIKPNDIFSPAQFAGKIEKLGNVRDVFFKGAAKKELDEFTDLMRAVQRSGQIAENPPTGQRLMPLAAGSAVGGLALSGNIPAAVGAVSLPLAWRALNTSRLGRRMLAASQDPVTAPGMQRILNTMSGQGARSLATEGQPDR